MTNAEATALNLEHWHRDSGLPAVSRGYKKGLLRAVKGVAYGVRDVLRCTQCTLSGDRDKLASRNQVVILFGFLFMGQPPGVFRTDVGDKRFKQ